MSLKLILSKIKIFFKPSFILQKNKEYIEKEDLDKKKKRNFIMRFIWESVLKRIITLKDKKKLNNSKISSEKHSSKSLKKKKIEKENEKHDSMFLDKDINYIERLIQNYEEFIQRDLLAVIRDANAVLRKWKSDLIDMISKGNELQQNQILSLANNLQEMSELYVDTKNTLDLVSNKFTNYQAIVKDTKRVISPQQKLNQLQSHLDKVITGLEKEKHIADLSHNNDYKYLYKHVNGKSSNGRLMSL